MSATDPVGFKRVNDSPRHRRGVEVLVETPRYPGAHTDGRNAVLRVGSEEFPILLRGPRMGAIETVRQRLIGDAGAASIGFTAGSSAGDAGTSLAAVWADADRAPYRQRAAPAAPDIVTAIPG